MQVARRLVAELVGTFFLVLVAAGAGMVQQAYPGGVSDAAAVVAPGVMVMAIIMFMGKIAGAHLNPVVTFAFALRADFPWRRVPGYWTVQVAGAVAAAWFLQIVIDVSAEAGATHPGEHTTAQAAFLVETVLTLGLVSVILGTASGAQNVGIIAAIGVGGYIALAGLWAGPLTDASMNPTRSLGPALMSGSLSDYWLYLVGPFLGASLAVPLGWFLRGRGGGATSSRAAQGTLGADIPNPDQP